MLITLIGLATLIIGIVLWVVGEKCCGYDNCSLIIGAIITILGILWFSTCMIVICMVQVPKQKDYESMLYKREVLEYRLEHKEENTIGNELLYNDIVDFNEQLRSAKKWSSNIWMNWFNNDKIATIEYINYKLGDK